MNTTITLTLDEDLVRQARQLAAARDTTLEALLQSWLEAYVAEAGEERVAAYRELMERLSHVDAGRRFSRDEMNERR